MIKNTSFTLHYILRITLSSFELDSNKDMHTHAYIYIYIYIWINRLIER